MTEKVLINEVGPRDGLQNQPVHVSTGGKLALVEALVGAGIREIEVTSFVSPKAVPQMADAHEVFTTLPKKAGVTYSALVLNEKGYERARAAGVGVIALGYAATETMNRKNINMSLDEARAVTTRILEACKADGVPGRVYISAAFICAYEGLVDPAQTLDITAELLESGADRVIIADTIGGASPTAVFNLFEAVKARFGLDRIAAHFHDTRALALANSWAALKVGCRMFDSAIAGLGGCPFAPGAAGNVATEDLVLMLSQCGFETGIDVDGLRKAVRLAERLVDRPLGGRMLPWLESQEQRENKTALGG